VPIRIQPVHEATFPRDQHSGMRVEQGAEQARARARVAENEEWWGGGHVATRNKEQCMGAEPRSQGWLANIGRGHPADLETVPLGSSYCSLGPVMKPCSLSLSASCMVMGTSSCLCGLCCTLYRAFTWRRNPSTVKGFFGVQI